MLDLLRRRAFLVTGGLFLVYGVAAMGGSVVVGSAPETTSLPEVDADFLRMRVDEEALEPVADPFQVSPMVAPPVEEESQPSPGDGPLPPSIQPSPLPSEREPIAVAPEPLPIPVPPDNEKDLFEWPEDFLMRLDATMSAGGSRSARINGELLEVGQSLTVAGERFQLVDVRGVRAVLLWRGHRVALDLLESPSVGPGEMPIDP